MGTEYDNDDKWETGHGIASAIIDHYEDKLQDKVTVKLIVNVDEDLKEKINKLTLWVIIGISIFLGAMVTTVVAVYYLLGDIAPTP